MMSQEGRPIAFASRALSEAESNYAPIELEILAVKFACDRFHYYVYGRKTTITTDHRPLISVFQKPIEKLPLGRVRSLRCKLLHYDLHLKYLPGRYMYVPDCLSRIHDKNDNDQHEEIPLMVHDIQVKIPMHQGTFHKIQVETQKDDELKHLLKLSKDGWPLNISQLPNVMRKYWMCYDSNH